MSIQSEINRINSNVQAALNAVADTGVSVPEGANSDNLPVAVSALANEKQDKLTGTQGQVVGFGPDGRAVAQDRESDVFWATYNATTYAEVVAAHQAGKLVQFIRSNKIYRLFEVNEGRAEFQAYASDYQKYNAYCYADNTWDLESPRYIAGKSVSITLSASAWNSESMTQTVPVIGVSSNEGKQLITPTPSLSSQAAYYEAGILCTGQATDSLTFTCTTVPTEDLTVYVVIQGVYNE